ncbi:MAG: cupin domain-containing protein, partial [Planctomycetaceae bacterium]
GFWYDQPDDEWVMLLSGAALLRFENELLAMKPGDHVLIGAHRKHRVEWTHPDEPSVWLAVHFAEGAP